MANRQEPYVKVSEVIKRVPDLLDITGTSNIGLVMVSAVGPRLAYIQGPAEFLSTYTTDGEIPRNADVSFVNAYYLSFSAGLVIVRSMNTTATQGVLFSKTEAPLKVTYKDGQLMTKQLEITLTPTEETKWSFVLNDTVFFNGSYASISADPDYAAYQNFVECDDLSDVADGITNWQGCVATYAANKLTIQHDEYAEFVTEATLNKNIEVKIPMTEDVPPVQADTELIEIPKSDWLFSVYAKTPQIKNIYNVAISTISGDDENFELKLGYPDEKGDNKVDSYMVSLFPEANDLNGSNSYIDNLNTLDIDFGIEVFTEEVMPSATDSAVPYGMSGLDLSASKKASNLNSALAELEDQVKYDIEYIAPVGLTNLQFIKRFTQAGISNDWFAPVDVPVDRTNANSIQQYFREVDNSSDVYACGPFDKNSGLTGWINYIACSTLYYERVMTNKAQGAEFAPVFDEEFGTVQMTNPVINLGKKDREKLLNFGAPVNFVMYNQRSDLYYLNNNLTHQSVDDIVSEEQNRRIVNKIKKDLKRLMNQFKGKYNTNSTRENVVSLIDYYFQQNIMNQQFAPDAYEVVCDETNNPAEIIRANKLAVTVKVRLYNSIKYIEVLNEVFPIGVDFNQ